MGTELTVELIFGIKNSTYFVDTFLIHLEETVGNYRSPPVGMSQGIVLITFISN
jgi:hypothetical protein